MSFRDEFFSARRLPERIRHRTPAAIANSARGIWSDRARSCEFPRFARELALNA
jgi:hypothetical protein